MLKSTLAFVISLLMILSACTQPRPDVIERPSFEVWNSTILEIDKIEMNDTATIIYFDAFFRPGWWIKIVSQTYIRESGQNEKLIVTQSEGIPLDEEYYMPESGQASFKLFFPPLAPHITKIDFIESDCNDCFKILGINLLPDAKIAMASIPVSKKPSVENLPEPVFSTGNSIVKGLLHGFTEDMSINSLKVYASNPVYMQDGETTIQILPDGSFSGEVSTGFPSLVKLDQYSYMLLSPGTTAEVTIDLKRKSRFESRYRTDKEDSDSIYIFFKDHLFTANDYKLLSTTVGDLQNFDIVFKDTNGMTPDAYKDYFLNRLESKIAEIEQLEASQNIKSIMEAQAKALVLRFLLSYEMIYREAWFRTNNIPWQERRTAKLDVPKPDLAYYSSSLELLSDGLILAPEYNQLVTSLFYGETFGLNKGNAIARINHFKEKISPYLKGNNNNLFDLALAQLYGSQLDEGFYSDDDKQEIQKAFNNKTFAEELISRNDALLAIIEANKTASGGDFVINDIPDVSQEEMFTSILSKYTGKVVVVDFWATWCGPCISAMESMKPLKESMKDKDVVFVYLTGNTSPLGTWNKMIPHIHGEHYRVDGSQWQYWYQNLSIEGVPTFMIHDKSGKQVSRHTGFPGVEIIKESIEKGLL
jgi:thiol-disulfide isomerase/thioredoxin